MFLCLFACLTTPQRKQQISAIGGHTVVAGRSQALLMTNIQENKLRLLQADLNNCVFRHFCKAPLDLQSVIDPG